MAKIQIASDASECLDIDLEPNKWKQKNKENEGKERRKRTFDEWQQ